MGIYDREYYRRDGPGFLDSLAGRGAVCKWLIMINIGIFLLQFLTLGKGGRVGSFTESFWLDPRLVLEGQVWRLLTYAFLHADLLHILFNMLFLWWFGSDLEEIYGSKEFLSFYLVGALFGGLFHVSCMFLGLIPPVPCLGASGAVTAVLILCASHFPTRTILLFFILPVPIWLFAIFNVVQDLFGLLGGSTSNTAFSVHLGGAAFGFAYYHRQWHLLNLLPDLRSWGQRRPQLRVYREEEHDGPHAAVSVVASAPNEVDEHLEAKVDALLEKVARHGQSSLTESERQILMRASEVYKRRRGE